MTDMHSVLAVVTIADAADAAAVVGYARDNETALSTQLTGHGASSAADSTILVRTAGLDHLDVNPVARTARIGAGISWGAVQQMAAPHGLTGTAGSAPHVGVTGYTLGGGMSWFGRAHGWAADHVRSFDVVTADGTQRAVTADSDAELFWALRGGGGDFALVTGMEFALHQAPELFGGQMTWPASRAAAVFSTFREVTATAPDELTLWCALAQPPGGAPALVQISCTYLGDEASGRHLLGPFDLIAGSLSDTRRPMSVADLGAITAEPQRPSPALQQGTLLTDLPEDVMTDVLTRTLHPLIYLQVRHLGGRLAQPSDTAAGPLPHPYFALLGGLNTSAETAAALRAQIAVFRQALAPVDADRAVFNFLSTPQTASDVYSAPTLNRLRQAKKRYDPYDTFRSNYPVIADSP